MYLLQKQFVKCSVNGKFRLFMAMSRRASSTMYSNTYTVSFDNYERAFKSKKSMQLVKSMCIYKACSYPWLVKNSEMLMNGTKSMLGTNFYNALVKKTIYSQFVAGENGPEIENTIKRFNEVNVRPLMVYSIENECEQSINFTNVKDHIKEMDNIFEKSVNKILNAIDTSSMFQNLQPKLAVKISSLVNEDVLVLISIISLADRLSRSSEGIESVNGMTLTKSNKKLVRKFHAFFCKHDVTFSNLLNNNIDKTIINCLIEQNLISTIEFNCISKYWTRLLRIFHYAHLKNVHVMIDGEQSYFQHGINAISLNLMEIFNKGEPFVYNTYQTYLKSCDDLIIQDIKYSKEKNFTFAVKLVRGAYMNKENKRCNKLKIPSPFQNSYEETSNCFQNCTDICIENMNKLDNGLHVMFATHNEESILYAIEQMKKIDITLQENISFGQLMGMCDYITLTLAKENYKTYKYIPFGLVDEVMPYLIRRIQENSDVLKNVGKEITMIKSELQRRTIYRLSTQKLFKSDGI